MNPLKAVSLIVLVSSLFLLKATAQTDSVKVDLTELSLAQLQNVKIITASKTLQEVSQAPATVMVVTSDQIRLRGYRNLAEIINDLPDFIVNDKSDPQFYNLVGARGILRQDHFVILLDGIRISSPTNEPLPVLENFPIYLAKQIEVVYGPGSALYGADAMAGVINIITQKAVDDKDLAVAALGGTQGYSNTHAFFNKKLKNDVTLSVAGQYSYDAQPDFSKIYQDEFDMTSHQTGVFNTAYGPMNPQQPIAPGYEAPVKAYNMYSAIEKGGFSMKILHHYVAVSTSTTMKPDNAVYNKDVFYGHGVTTGSASFSTGTGNLKSLSTITGSFYKVNPKSNFRNLYGGVEHGYKYSTGSMMKVEEQLNYSLSKKLNFTGGFTYELFQSIPKSPELQAPMDEKEVRAILLNSAYTNNPDGIEVRLYPLVYTNIGSYLQGQYFPVKKLALTAGVRYDHNSRFGSTVNPRTGVVFNPSKTTTLKALYGTAFWAPSPLVSFETYGSFYSTDSGTTYQSSYLHLPNPGLKPMISRTTEISINRKVGKKFSATLTAYHTQIDNIIKDVADNGNTNLYNNKFLGWDVGYVEVPFNEGKQINYGGHIALNSAFGIGKAKLNAYSSLSYLEGKIVDRESQAGEVEQAVISPWQFRAGFDGKWNDFHFSARLLHAGRQRMTAFADADPEKRRTISGYSLLNVSAGYTYGDNITFFIKVENTLNQNYRSALGWDTTGANAVSFSSGYQNPLRAIAGIRVGF